MDWMTRGLRAQSAAIRTLNADFEGFHLFAGVECDILRDGALDSQTKTCPNWITWSHQCIRRSTCPRLR